MAKGRGTSRKKKTRPWLDAAGRIGELVGVFVRQVHKLNTAELDHWVGRKGVLSRQIGDVLHAPFKPAAEPKSETTPQYGHLLADWEGFYREVFGLKADLSGVIVPERQPGFDRLLVVVQGMTPERVFQKCRENFSCWKYTGDGSLDDVLDWDKEARNANDGTYAVWVRNRAEADEELKNRSTNHLAESQVNTVTLTERLLYELKSYKETGEHLDQLNVTLCAGSRYRDGDAPCVHWYDAKLIVNRCSPGGALGALRARQVVSLAT